MITHTVVSIVRDVITDEMRDTERNPAAGGRSTAGGSLDARRSRHRGRRVVEALGDELGELLHPHGYQGNSRARRRASAPTALAAAAVAVARDPSPGRHVDGRHIPTSTSRRHASSRTPFGRRPIRTRMGVMEPPRGDSPSFSFQSRHDPGLAAPRPLPGGRHDLSPKPMLISICARFSARRGNARGETTPRPGYPPAGGRSVGRCSATILLSSPVFFSAPRMTARAAVFTWRQKQAAGTR